MFEVLEIDSQIKKMVRGGHFLAVGREIERQGGLYMKEDALIKAILGITTIDEVLRVSKE